MLVHIDEDLGLLQHFMTIDNAFPQKKKTVKKSVNKENEQCSVQIPTNKYS